MVVPLIIHFKMMFPYKPSILGYPHLWKPPDNSMDFLSCSNNIIHPESCCGWLRNPSAAELGAASSQAGFSTSTQ